MAEGRMTRQSRAAGKVIRWAMSAQKVSTSKSSTHDVSRHAESVVRRQDDSATESASDSRRYRYD